MKLPEALALARQHAVAGRHDEASAFYVAILKAVPRHHEALYMLATLLHLRGRQQEALPLINTAVEVQPTAAARQVQGQVLQAIGRAHEAAAAYRAALALAPDNADTLQRLANVLLSLKQPVEAESLLRRLLAIRPDHPEGTALLGVALLDQARYLEAEPLLRRIHRAYPNETSTRANLGITLFYLGEHCESHEMLRKSLADNPAEIAAYSPLLFCLSCDGGFTPAEYLEAVRTYGRAVQRSARAFTQWRHAPGHQPLPTLRVGLVSSDLGEHPVGYFLDGILAHIDPARIELYAYSTFPRQDALNERLHAHVAQWRDIHNLPDQEAAARIHADGIDILVDLSGHTARNRLPLFAWKPAPVQVSWLGYFASTGLAEIDWILADPVAVRTGEEGQFSERCWRLPETRLCFSPPSAAPAVSALPALQQGHVTFGSFQNMLKLSSRVLMLWSRVLAAVPGSRLRLQNSEFSQEGARDAMRTRLAACGIAADRVDFHGWTPREAYLACYGEVDILLDSFPYPGGTTTCEGLWMGVPTITLRGNTLLSRQGASILTNAGLPDWVADDEDAFVAKAAARAADLPGLAVLRSGLRDSLAGQPIFDGRRFAAHFTDAMHGLWLASAR